MTQLKWTKDLIRYFSKDDVQTSKSLDIISKQGLQIGALIRCRCALVRVVRVTK